MRLPAARASARAASKRSATSALMCPFTARMRSMWASSTASGRSRPARIRSANERADASST
jgi:hypothetical protein